MEPWEVAQCMNDLSGPTADPWLAVYGDSLTRGVFFDIVSLFNSSAGGSQVCHGDLCCGGAPRERPRLKLAPRTTLVTKDKGRRGQKG